MKELMTKWLLIVAVLLLPFGGSNMLKASGVTNVLGATAAGTDYVSVINAKTYGSGHQVIYEMNVASFSAEGTFVAAQQKLSQLKMVGIDIIWLMPVYPRDGGLNSPYAAVDFKQVNPSYGTIADFKNFVAAAHRLGMKVWLDWVPNHTATIATWVKTHPEYYKKSNGVMVHPNNYGDVYQLDYTNPALVEAMNDCLKFWIDQADIDGYRCDYISSPEIPASYWTSTIPMLKSYKAGKEIVMLGESDFTDKNNERLKTVGFDYDYAWGFQTKLAGYGANNTYANPLKIYAQNLIKDSKTMNVSRMVYLTNHDQNWNEKAKTLSAKYGNNRYLLTVYVSTIWGMPLVYNGQEIGGVNSYDFMSGGLGSGAVNVGYSVDMVTGLKNIGVATTPQLTEIYQNYVKYAKAKLKADKNPMMWFLDQGQPKLDEIEITERCVAGEEPKADAAIITIGRQAGEGMDRQIDGEFNLSKIEQDMIFRVSDAFHAKGKKVIVIINSGSVMETASWRDRVDAILVAWQPGIEGGNSVADILTGKVNPSGKLTMTWPIAATDHPSTANFAKEYDMYTYKNMESWGKGVIPGVDFSNHEEDIYVGYRYFDTFKKNVAYPFGYGLSYTTFEMGKPAVKVHGNNIEVSVTIKNTGKVAGKQVAQVYVTAPKGAYEKPLKELKTFGKTRELKPGESQTLKMTLEKRDLASFDEANSQWKVDAGNYLFQVGTDVESIKGTATLKVAEYTEKTSNACAPNVQLNYLKQK